MPFPTRGISPVAALLMIALVLVVAACSHGLPPEAPWEQEARMLLDRAEALAAKRQMNEAAVAADRFFTLYPKSRHMDRANFLMGEIRLAQRDFSRALSYYKEVIEKYPASPLILDAKFRLGSCYFELKEYDLAVANLADRSRIADPAKLRRSAEMLSSAYAAKKNHPAALREFVFLAETAQNEKQRAGYRDRIRELIDKLLTEDELQVQARETASPADLALLRLAQLRMERREYRDAVPLLRQLLDRFPASLEKVRAELLLTEASSMLTAPRYFLGALAPRTGPAAPFGDKVVKGAQLAVLAYNTRNPDERVELLIRDTEGSADKAAAAFTELAGKGVVAVVGPLLTKEVSAIAPLLEKLQIPLMTPSAAGAGLTDLSPWIFRNAMTSEAQAAAAAQFAVAKKLRRIAILHPDDPYGKDLVRLFVKNLGKGAEISATISYPPDANDFGPYIRKLMEIDFRAQRIAIPEDDQERKRLFQYYTPSFDGLYLPGYADRVGLLIPQLAFYNIKEKTIIGSNNWHSPDLVERAGQYAEGAVFVDGFFPESSDPAIKGMVDGFRAAYQEEPDYLGAQAYDAATLVLNLLKEKKNTPPAVKDGLLAVTDFPGVSGKTTFAGSGEARKQLFLITIVNGAFTLLKN